MLRKSYIFIACSLFLLSFSKIDFIGIQENDEYEVKAAFIYNFTKFIEWEDESLSNSSTFKIVIYKDSPIEEHLNKLLSSKKVKNKKIEVIQISNLSDIPKAHIVFLPDKTVSKDFKICTQNSNSSLIISEKQGRLNLGASINFLNVSNHIKFEINMNSLKKNKLKASSQLLKLAENVE
ncbi:MAG: YfiR family protein [Bacteroidota bacterium]